MMTGMKYAALASVLMFTAGSAAWAQNYSPNSGMTGNSNPGVQSPLGQSGPGVGVSTDTQQKIRQALEQSGFKDVHVLPQSFLIRAQAPDGSRVVMLMSPDMVSGVVAESGNQNSPGTASGTGPGTSSQLSATQSSSQSRQQAEQELSRYGYTDLTDVRPMQGWAADATRNGENVRVILSENGLVATFPGK